MPAETASDAASASQRPIPFADTVLAMSRL